MSVVWTWHGAATPTSVWVRARVEGTDSSAELLVSEQEDMSGPVTYGPVSPDSVDMVSIDATGLDADTRYYYRWVIDDVEQTDFDGTFLTAPPDDGRPHNFIFAVAGDAGLTGNGDDSYITSGVSNNPVFDTMRNRALSEGWLGFCHLGDFFYRDGESTDASHFRDTYDDVLTYNGAEGASARQGRFFRSVNMTLAQDDHDLMDNNTDSTSPGRDPALTVYRESAPHYRLPAGDGAEGIYQSWRWGRVLFVQCDVRAYRDPNADFDDDPSSPKTMLGSGQKSWMERVLRNSDAQALVWIVPSLWLSDQGDQQNIGVSYSGGGYSHDSFRRFRQERKELVELLGDHGWLNSMVALQADKHALSMSTGPANPWGGFPLFMFASMDSGFSDTPEGQYDLGQSPGRQRYGTVRVEDSGHTIALHGTGYINDAVWRSHTAYAHVEPRTIALDYQAGHVSPPLEPTNDDQQLTNDFTASRQDGGEVRYERENGPVSVQDPPNGVGRYTGSETFNVASDDQLPSQAGWHVHKGTVDKARYPSVTVDLTDRTRAGLRPDVARLDVGDRVTIDNPPSFLPPEQIDLIAEGYEETINLDSWEITYNASPAESTQVAQVGPDLILNSNHNFETTIYGWRAVGSTVTRTREHAYRGQYAGRMEPDGTSSNARILTRMEDSPRVYAGIEYEFSVWVRSAAGYDVDMSVQWFDADGTSISFPFILPSTSIPAEEWTQLTASAVAPEDAHRLQWYINQRDTPASTDVLWVDQAIISDGADPGTNAPNRADTTGSELAVGVGADDTEFVVHTVQNERGDQGARWINSDGPTFTHPQQIPVDLRLAGEVVRVTRSEPAGWDLFRDARPADTWGTSESGHAWIDTTVADTTIGTSDSSQYGFVQLNASTETIRVQRLDLGTDIADCEVLWSVRTNQVSSGSSQLPSLLLRYQGGTDYYRCRVHLNADETVSVSITRGTSQVGGTVDLPLLTYAASADLDDRIWVRTRIIGHRVLARAWTITPPTGESIGPELDTSYQEPPEWHIDREITDPLTAGQIGFSTSTFSGYSGTDPSMRYQLVELVTPQRMTVTRSINGVSKTHDAGTEIGLATPATIAL
ncbi:phosphodiesterase/alkaline phosphatase D-like protein [Haloactinospora alba]|uniref:Phosphodiesterase/alkaline phosphatase D-like protein n=1 Tax=Haloactinospora alba TaxID=405555 RepID=A0A543NFL2_9ACTN|nr:alkaline phosphatase D family protein [Haloactinospora alba]TQN30622.1 phosphodiesterase/alkaline phosphatase D-like protein [Haloactinospora alba]